MNVVPYTVFADLHEKHDREDATFLVDGASPIQNVRVWNGLDSDTNGVKIGTVSNVYF
jgi:hypothetical protein